VQWPDRNFARRYINEKTVRTNPLDNSIDLRGVADFLRLGKFSFSTRFSFRELEPYTRAGTYIAVINDIADFLSARI
jgi:hypothetical protein